jgi:PmbA protein
MLDFMHKGLKLALESCDQVEIYGERGDVFSIDLEREEVKKVKHVKSAGIGVRVVIANKIGFSHTTALEKGKIEECVAHALKQARVSEQDTYFAGLPAPMAGTSKQGYKEPEKTFDQRIVALLGVEGGSEDAIGYCKEMLTGMKEHKVKKGVRCTPTEGSFAAGFDEIFILNSEGIEAHDKGTYVSAGIAVVASEDGSGEEISGYESKVSRMLGEIDFGWIGHEAVKIAVDSLRGKQLKTKELPVIFSPKAVQSLFAYTVIPQLSAENVQRKQSPYHGKKGTAIASEILTIVDDGTMPLGVNSRKMDGEGVPAQPTTIVEKGVLKNFLYDSYTANKDRVESTGNALRSFDSLPFPGATNFIIKGEGIAPKEEIIGDIREGLFISDVIGAHTASRASGDFSVVAQNAFGIKKGDLFPVKHVMIAGNMQEVLKHVEMIGDDARQIYNVVSPSIKVSRMQVIA